MNKKWKNILTASALLTFSLSSYAQPESNRYLVFTNWGPYISTDLLEQFTQETGINVIYSTYESNETLYSKLKSQPNYYDLVVPSTYFVSKMRDNNMLQAIDKSKLTHYGKSDPLFLDKPFDSKNDYSIPHVVSITGIAINTDMYDPNDFTQWSDLWRPELKGKVMLMDDTREVFHIALKKLGYSGNTTNLKEIQEANEELKALMPNVLGFNSSNPAAPYLSKSSGIGMLWNGAAAAMQRSGFPLAFVYPKDGGIFWMDSLAIPKKARNVDEAHQMINFLLRPDIAAKISERSGYLTAIKSSNLAYKDNSILFPNKAIIDNGEWQSSVGKMDIHYENYFLERKSQQQALPTE